MHGFVGGTPPISDFDCIVELGNLDGFQRIETNDRVIVFTDEGPALAFFEPDRDMLRCPIGQDRRRHQLAVGVMPSLMPDREDALMIPIRRWPDLVDWISCLVNPSVGREWQWRGDRFTCAGQARRVLVVGGVGSSLHEEGRNDTLDTLMPLPSIAITAMLLMLLLRPSSILHASNLTGMRSLAFASLGKSPPHDTVLPVTTGGMGTEFVGQVVPSNSSVGVRAT
ncbi:MAG: hypothetical protein HC869_21095 [Rhodospirillales bacterium]|nr:hypothetical protein [Rhodospirillales bacterium]